MKIKKTISKKDIIKAMTILKNHAKRTNYPLGMHMGGFRTSQFIWEAMGHGKSAYWPVNPKTGMPKYPAIPEEYKAACVKLGGWTWEQLKHFYNIVES